jgi:hypothetical protein
MLQQAFMAGAREGSGLGGERRCTLLSHLLPQLTSPPRRRQQRRRLVSRRTDVCEAVAAQWTTCSVPAARSRHQRWRHARRYSRGARSGGQRCRLPPAGG